MEEEFSACTTNGFQTEITLTTQCLLAFICAFEKMGLFVPGAFVEDRVKRGHLRLKKCLKELAMTPQLTHVPLPMPWVQISLQCCEFCINKTSMHTTSRKYKDWDPTTSHLVFDLSSDFCNGASWILPFLHKSCLLMRQKHTSGTTRIRTLCSSEFSREIQRKHLGWNSWRLSARTCHHSRPFEWGSLLGIPPEHVFATHGGDTSCDTQTNVVPTWWRSSALQPASTSTSEQSLQGEMDRERGTCCMASKIAWPNTRRFFHWGPCEKCCVH